MASPTSLELVSLLAPNADPFYEALAATLTAETGLAVHFESALGDRSREAKVEGDGPVLATLCGGLFARRGAELGLEAIAAPVLVGERYQGRPVFFSDVVTAPRLEARSLLDLRGRLFAFNDIGSLSGLDAVHDRLDRATERPDFFRAELLSGSHQASLDMIVSGLADVAAIDSGVLELELAHRPLLRSRIRVVESLGPYPSHPIAVRASLPADVKARISAALLDLEASVRGREVLALGRVARFVPADSSVYAPLGEIGRGAHCNDSPRGDGSPREGRA
jgi:phosphonate transport system substrate-binding protein